MVGIGSMGGGDGGGLRKGIDRLLYLYIYIL